MAVRLTAPHPVHGNPGDIVEDLDVQTERDLITAGYAVHDDASKRKHAKAGESVDRGSPSDK